MSGSDILNQDEIDALLHGVDSGAVKTEAPVAPGEARNYDFSNQVRIVRGRMPTLEMINERFARLFRISLFNLLRRTPEVAVAPVKMLKFSEYVHTLHVPTNLNLVKIVPLRGTGLIVIDPKLVFTTVDNFFGGNGRYAKIEGREFTATEQRIIHMLLKHVFADLKEAWSHVQPLDIEYVNSEINPHFANIVSPTEIVVITSFHVELDGGGGDIHITMPYAMIEPLRELLDAGVASDRVEHDERWVSALKEEIEDAEVELTTLLGRSKLTMRQLMDMKAGDILPCDFNGRATVMAEDVPIFRGKFGVSNGQQAVQIEDRISRVRPRMLDILNAKV
ncbi:flagellar motor switch protein FliM [Steroidobacter agaridevorans]|uniref:Flagellar motor switch protein FliM n=1 Tax=Steroidobacter agaridevorans TaxID=2695856 RepID=A0A829YIQ1_9GAMM|nr:flagellar motor switch protein FliM [Steroidobacter agaridevorans]GFE83205.1 flagellar motor switch protein FliM [Steroidobacter agaridevorans]GFE86286.1 flagellar motor switch protein FliM [Steroidobacter agaridevorans]